MTSDITMTTGGFVQGARQRHERFSAIAVALLIAAAVSAPATAGPASTPPTPASRATNDSAAATDPDKGFGVTAAFFEMEFFGENQVTPGVAVPGGLSDLHYQDVFGAGQGGELGINYSLNRYFRVTGSYIKEKAPGRYAAGGEFPGGITFSDYELTGFTVGALARYPAGRFAPYALMELGQAQLSAVNADTGSGMQPYWNSTSVPFSEIGFGTEIRLGRNVALTLDARIQYNGDTGQPTPAAGFVSTATSTAATMFCIGVAVDITRSGVPPRGAPLEHSVARNHR